MSTTDSAGAEPRRRPVYEVVLSLDGLARIAAVVLVAVVVLSWISRAQAAIGLILVAAVCAICLESFITKLGRTIGSAPALVAVHVVALLLFGGDDLPVAAPRARPRRMRVGRRATIATN
jgi:hypothetical protein